LNAARVEERQETPRTRLLALAPWLTALVVSAGPLLLSVAITPGAIERGEIVLSPPCSIKAITGRDCPTCGLSRAFAALGHGDLDGARRYHRGAPFLYGSYLVGAGIALAGTLRALLRRPHRSTRISSPP
jgi:hypothetical protein